MEELINRATEEATEEQPPIMSQSTRMLYAFQALGTRVYEGTVPAHVKQKRRARNKVAKASRKRNRRG